MIGLKRREMTFILRVNNLNLTDAQELRSLTEYCTIANNIFSRIVSQIHVILIYIRMKIRLGQLMGSYWKAEYYSIRHVSLAITSILEPYFRWRKEIILSLARRLESKPEFSATQQ